LVSTPPGPVPFLQGGGKVATEQKSAQVKKDKGETRKRRPSKIFLKKGGEKKPISQNSRRTCKRFVRKCRKKKSAVLPIDMEKKKKKTPRHAFEHQPISKPHPMGKKEKPRSPFPKKKKGKKK